MSKNYKFKYQSSRKSSQAITRFSYNLQEIVPDIFQGCQGSTEFEPISLSSVSANNQVAYFYAKHSIGGDCLVDEESLLYAIKSAYLEKKNEGDCVLRVNDQSFNKRSVLYSGLLSTSWQANEVLDFVLIRQEWSEKGQRNYEFYVIHHCNAQEINKSIRWSSFVEKYVFQGSRISYLLIASCNQDQSYLTWSSNQTAFKQFIQTCFNLNKIQGGILQYQGRIKERIQIKGDNAFSEDNNQMSKVPSEFMKGYYGLRKQFGEEHDKHIARFYVAKEFSVEQTRKMLSMYLEWRQEMVSSYKWEDFEEFHRMQIFTLLGEDYMGRPVVLNKAKNVRVDEMDLDKYCIYYMFYMEIYLPSKMRGKVSQINIIADLQDIGANNFKLAVTRRNISDGSTYCAERQYKFFAVNVNMFAYYCWKFIKPLLPKKTAEKVFIGGNDMTEIRDSLLEEMSMETIPTFLGGSNPSCE